MHRKQIIITILIAALLVGIVSTQSMPGEVLYWYKTRITEPSLKLVYPTAASKARFEVTLVKKRLREAGDLLAQGRLNEQNFTAWSEAFSAASSRVSSRSKSLAGSGKSKALLGHAYIAESSGYSLGFVAAVKAVPLPESQEKNLLVAKVTEEEGLQGYIAGELKKLALGQYNSQEYIRSIDDIVAESKNAIALAENQAASVQPQIPKAAGLELEEMLKRISPIMQASLDKRAGDFYSQSYILASEAKGAASEVEGFIMVWRAAGY